MWPRAIGLGLVLFAVGCGVSSAPSPEALPHSSGSVGRDNDPELEEAVAKAKKTLGTFINRLQHPQRAEVFSVEAKFPAEDGSPVYLWIADPQYKDGSFSGKISTEPKKRTSVKSGDPVTIKEADVTDWMILKSGDSEGGFTVDVRMRREAQPK